MDTQVVISASMAQDLLLQLVLLGLTCGIGAVLAGGILRDGARHVARWFDKRGKPPTVAMKLAVARNLRKRAAQLEIEAEKMKVARQPVPLK